MQLSYSSNNFLLKIILYEYKVNIDMVFLSKLVNTRDYPHTLIFLREHFPSVIRTRCFNYKKNSFEKELEETELGHLFEHILLESLCKEKLSKGFKDVIFSGRTWWNWEKEKRGIFHITIKLKQSDLMFLSDALAKSIHLIENLIRYEIAEPVNKFTPMEVSHPQELE